MEPFFKWVGSTTGTVCSWITYGVIAYVAWSAVTALCGMIAMGIEKRCKRIADLEAKNAALMIENNGLKAQAIVLRQHAAWCKRQVEGMAAMIHMTPPGGYHHENEVIIDVPARIE